MNPPSGQDSEETDYRGSEPLDPALADRFTHIVQLQGWERLSESERIAVIRARDGDASNGQGDLPSLLGRIRLCRDLTEESIGEDIARYVSILVGLVGNAGISLSPRRGGMLYRAILAIHAAGVCLRHDTEAADSAWLALLHPLDPHKRTGSASRPQSRAIGPGLRRRTRRRQAGALGNVLSSLPAMGNLPAHVRPTTATSSTPSGAVNAALTDQKEEQPS